MANRAISNMKKMIFASTALMLLFGLGGCATTKLSVGEVDPKPVETSGSESSWVKDDMDSYIKSDKLYIRAQTEDVDFDYARRVALDSEANERVVSSIQTEARREFGQAIKRLGVEDRVGKYGDNFITALAQEKYPAPIRERLYWTKHKKQEAGNRVSYVYRAWGLYYISVADYEKAKVDAWDKTIAQVEEKDLTAQEDLMAVRKELHSTTDTQVE